MDFWVLMSCKCPVFLYFVSCKVSCIFITACYDHCIWFLYAFYFNLSITKFVKMFVKLQWSILLCEVFGTKWLSDHLLEREGLFYKACRKICNVVPYGLLWNYNFHTILLRQSDHRSSPSPRWLLPHNNHRLLLPLPILCLSTPSRKCMENMEES